MLPRFKFLSAFCFLLSTLALSAQPNSPTFIPGTFPTPFGSVLYGTTGVGVWSNINNTTTIGTYTTSNWNNGTAITGLRHMEGFGMATEITETFTNATGMTNGPQSAFFAPSLDGVHPLTTSNAWWEVVAPVAAASPFTATNRVFGSNFSSTMLAGWPYVHLVGFKNGNTNYAVNVTARGSVPKY